MALKKSSFKGTLNRIKKLIINYWCIAIPAIFIAIFICNYKLSASEICKELLGLNTSVMIFSWYVPFYAVSLIVMSAIQKWLDKDIKLALFVGIILPMFIFSALKYLPVPNEIHTLFNNLRHWFPCITVGYLCNHNDWLKKASQLSTRFNNILISAILIVLCFFGRYFISGLDFVYCALMVFAILNLKIDINSCVGKILYICGKNSSNMWFLHCLYFGRATREYFQPLAYWSKFSLAIYITVVIELLLCSEAIIIIKKIFDSNCKFINQ